MNHLTYVSCACWVKMIKFPFVGKGERANGFLDLIHTYVCGPMSILTIDGFI